MEYLENYLEELQKIYLRTNAFHKFLPRMAAIHKGIYDSIRKDKTPVFDEVKKIIDKFIFGIDIMPYKDRTPALVEMVSYPGLTTPKEVRQRDLNPLKGFRFHREKVKSLFSDAKKISVKKVDGKKIYFSAPKRIKILYWETVGTYNVLTPGEQVAFALHEIGKWKDFDNFLKLLRAARIEFWSVIPYVEIILELFAYKYSRAHIISADNFVKSVGYGPELASGLGKLYQSKIMNMGIMIRLGSTIGAYLDKFARVTYKFPLFRWTSPVPPAGTRVEYLLKAGKEREVKRELRKLDGKMAEVYAKLLI